MADETHTVKLPRITYRDFSRLIICAYCETTFHPWPGRTDSRFCSLACTGAKARGPRSNHLEKFWAKVKKTDSCWLWTGGLSDNGYGKTQFGTKVRFVHRISYELATKAPVPDGMNVCHSCDTPTCTQLDNMRDMIKKGRGNSGGRIPKCQILPDASGSN
jgi:hypothetical protein